MVPLGPTLSACSLAAPRVLRGSILGAARYVPGAFEPSLQRFTSRSAQPQTLRAAVRHTSVRSAIPPIGFGHIGRSRIRPAVSHLRGALTSGAGGTRQELAATASGVCHASTRFRVPPCSRRGAVRWARWVAGRRPFRSRCVAGSVDWLGAPPTSVAGSGRRPARAIPSACHSRCVAGDRRRGHHPRSVSTPRPHIAHRVGRGL